MTFWIIICAMAALIAALLARAILKGGDGDLAGPAEFDLRVYRDQLAELDRDVARGVVPAEDAERIRAEISRRILAADSNRTAKSGGTGPRRALLGVLAVLLIGGSLALYSRIGVPGYGDLALSDRIAFADQMRATRPSQAEATENMPDAPAPEGMPAEFLNLIEKLRETVAQRPDDLQGNLLLAQNEARIGRFAASAKAQARVIELKGTEAEARDFADYAELLILAAGGYVSPEAETALRGALVQDEGDGRARYYIGLMMLQTGRPDIAFRIWDTLLRQGPPEAPWIDPITAQIHEVADLAGVSYSMPEIGGGTQRGPSMEDIEAASEMDATDRMEMIGGMVEGLSDRLATEGGPASDWARLITSLAILGQPDRARAIYDNAVEVFADEKTALDTIRRAGAQAGVADDL